MAKGQKEWQWDSTFECCVQYHRNNNYNKNPQEVNTVHIGTNSFIKE